MNEIPASELSPALCPPLCPALTDLTADHQQGTLQSPHHEFKPGVFLNSDPKLGLSGSYYSIPGRLLELKIETKSAGDWLGLHMVLPKLELQDLTYIGLACRLNSPAPLMLRACLRSGLPEGGFTDCFFDKHILSSETAHSHLDALYLDAQPNIPLTAEWRELILFLPCQSCDLNLVHLHPFAL